MSENFEFHVTLPVSESLMWVLNYVSAVNLQNFVFQKAKGEN